MNKILNKIVLLLGLLLIVGAANAQSYNMGTSGSQNITTCSAWIYDSGGSSGNYSASSDATMVINPATAGGMVSIIQGTYDTESNYDRLKIYDGVGTGGTLLATLEGTGSVAMPITSTQGAITLEFHSDGSVQREGFALQVTCSTTSGSDYNMPHSGSRTITTCDAWVYDEGGPNGDYAASSDATMIINPATPGDFVSIDIGSYTTEQNYDRLQIYDGVGTTGTLLDTWEGTGTLARSITSLSGSLTLKFHSDGSVQKSGFSLHVTCSSSSDPIVNNEIIIPTSGTQTVQACDAWIYDDGGSSSNYSNNCNGTLVVNPSTPGQTVVIDQGDYNFESCCDSLVIYEGVGTSGNVLARLRGTGTITSAIMGISGSITLVFRSDGSVNYTGFQLHASCVPMPEVVEMSSTDISTCNILWSDPGGYDNYANNTNITQTICSDNGQHIMINFLSFNLMSGDNLFVYDGNSTASPLLGTYTGSNLPPSIISSGTCLTFRFVSNASGNSSGWMASIHCAACDTPVSIEPGSPCAPEGTLPFCTDENPYGVTFPSGTSGNASTFFGSNRVGCLGSVPCPAWYFMRVNDPGNLLIYIEQTSTTGTQLDVDFACWGPFNATSQADFMENLCCGMYTMTTTIASNMSSHRPTNGDHTNDMGGYPYGNMVDCSFYIDATEWCYIPNAQPGQFYLLLITNYSQRPGTITFNAVNAGNTTSTATTDCSLLAQVANTGPYCEGDTIRLSCQNPEAGATYTWTGPNGWSSSSLNPTLPDATVAMAGDYSMVKHLNGHSSEPAITNVVVNSVPQVAITTTMDTVCDNEHATLTASGGNMYVWSNGTGGATLNVTPATSQFYTVTVTNEGNCRSVDSIYLVAAPTFTTNLRDTVCAGSGYFNYGFSVVADETINGQSRTLTATYASVMGCDSVVNLDLSFYPSPIFEFSATDCDSYTWNDSTYTQSGNYIQRFQSVNGCDSLVTLHLTIHNSCTTEFDAINCDTYTWNTQSYNQSGDYVQHFQTVNGCDSTVTLHLTINQSVTSQFTQTVCDSYTWNDQTYSQSGDYVQHFQTTQGCDSAVTLHLVVNPVISFNFAQTACDTFVWNDSIYTRSGDYVQQFRTVSGCDSTVTLHLTIHQSDSVEVNVTRCDTYTWNTQTYAQSGDYIQEFQTVHGCDSVVTLHLTIDSSVVSEFDTIGCESFTWNNQEYTQSGDYTQLLQTVNGCDSTVTMHLTIDRLTLSARNLQPEHCGHADGSATIEVTEHVAEVIFDWGNLQHVNGHTVDHLAVGDYSVAASDSMCHTELDFRISAAPTPHACFNVLPIAESVSLGTMMRFVNCSQSANQWFWDMGDGSTFTDQSVEYTYPMMGTYTVTLIVNDEFGCVDTASQDVRVREDMRFYVPNAFSPNGDGLNDVFIPIGTELSEEGYTLAIYNRWGELIFLTHRLDQGWDGTFKGRYVESGSVMHYIINYQNKDGRQFVSKGVVHVL